MNKKKIFSYLFIGLLAVGATGTVTSCKDYDDDINTVNTRVDGLQQTIAELQKQHAADVKALQDAQAEFATKIALRDTASALRSAAQAAAAQAEANATKRAQDLAEALQKTIDTKADKSAVSDLETSLKALIATKANQSDYEALLKQVNNLTASTYTKSETDKLIEQAKAALQGEIASINTELGKKLDKTTFDQKIDELTNDYKNGDRALDDKYAGIVATLATASDLQQQVEALNNLKDQINKQNLANSGRFSGIDGQLTDLTSRIQTLEKNSLTADNLKDLNKFQQTATDWLNITFPKLMAAKADADKVYTKSETYSQAQVDAKFGDLDGKSVKQALDDLNTAIGNTYTTKADFNTLSTTVAGITANVNNLNVLLAKSLTSLVYKAEKYALSFPEVEISSFDNLPVYTVDLTKDEPVAKGKETLTYAPLAEAKYWMNPSTADYTQYNYKFVDLETTNETRGHRDNVQCVDNTSLKSSAENGVLTIKFKVDAANVNDALTHEVNGQKLAWVSTIALQATKKQDNAAWTDTIKTITSDYALLTPSWYKDLRLGNNAYATEGQHEQGNVKYHLNTTVAATKTEDAAFNYSFIIPYTGDSIVALNKYIDLHYAYSATSTDYTQDHVMTNAQAQEKGFTFKYTLLKTATENNTAVAPTQFSVKGDTVSVADKSRAAVGTEGIVLVEMQAEGKTVAYGYVSFLISNNPVSMVENLSDLTLNCPTDANGTFDASADYKALTDSLATLLGYTSEEFSKNYYLAGHADARAMYANSDGDATDTKVGKIVVENGKLVWKFTEADVKKAFYKTDGTPNNVNEYSTYIQFATNNKKLTPDFRIKVTIPAIHRPAGSFAYDNRIQQYWYEAGSGTIASSPETRAEIHANVEVVGQPNADDELKYDISSTYVGNVFKIARATNTPAFTYADIAKVYFDASKYPSQALGADSTKYYLSLNDNATELYASEKEDGSNAQLVAQLTGDHNEIVEFQHNAYAENLLNVASHTALAVVPAKDPTFNTFTTHMVLDQKENCLPISLTGANRFDIRYLRPIDAVASAAANAYDAIDNGNKIYLADMVSFRDWRWTANTTQYAFGGKSAADADMTYINYYGISEIVPNLAKVRTNINGRDQLLSEVTNKITLTSTDKDGKATVGKYTKNASTKFEDFKNAIGYIYYGNVGSTVGGFYLDIPVTVKYDWGTTASTTIRINVNQTQGNAKRR